MGARDDAQDGIRDDDARDGIRDDDVRDGVWDDAVRDDTVADAATGAPDPADLPVPDLLELDLAELRTVRHPVLTDVLADLRARAGEPSEMLWGFNNAF
ncbi:FxSxx-COOH cyclophane-containing RiPP peptide [Streptomyces sp. NPDC056738]|uniref:FxSxx-COOH cyclophane-containing RiPP peptide n=1 Tax=Streptomyces sp. NPDC056738 TaxID=3345933 RepID=UPI0036C80779